MAGTRTRCDGSRLRVPASGAFRRSHSHQRTLVGPDDVVAVGGGAGRPAWRNSRGPDAASLLHGHKLGVGDRRATAPRLAVSLSRNAGAEMARRVLTPHPTGNVV